MRTLALACGLAVLAGCTPADKADTPADSAAAPAALTLADVAGTWNMESRITGGDTTVVRSTLVVTAEPPGATLTLEGRPPVAARSIVADGDSVVYETESYESVLRPGVQVWIRSVNRMVDGRMLGVITAHYTTTGADSVVELRSRGTRAP